LIQDEVVPPLISQDGRWWWDGNEWRTRLVEGQLDLFWFTSTPDWFTRVLIMGLIGIIPIVGAINLLGWTLTATDMVRRGWKELPPAGFQHLQRGVAPFVVSLVYGLVLGAVLFVLVFMTVFLATSGRAWAVIAVGLALLSVMVFLAWWLISLYLFGALITASDRLGIAKALDPFRLYKLARANHEISLHIAVIYGLASIAIAAIGFTLAFIIPFGGGILVSLGLPAVYAVVVPSLAAFRLEESLPS
jgi:MFS family permease